MNAPKWKIWKRMLVHRKDEKMATEKKKSEQSSPAGAESPVVFSKQKILTLKRYTKRRDLLTALLKDGERYTLDQVDGLMDDFMKGKVK